MITEARTKLEKLNSTLNATRCNHSNKHKHCTSNASPAATLSLIPRSLHELIKKTNTSVESASGILRSERGAAGFPRLPLRVSGLLGEQKNRVACTRYIFAYNVRNCN
jgi:hypothetical protein